MKLSSIQSRKYILGILKKLHAFIDSESFDPETDLEIVRSKKKDPKFSTTQTMSDFDYDASDVAACLRKLTTEKYSETLIDIDDPEPPYLFVFGDEINNRQIYIKLKIKEKTHKHILCVSFHYAKWKMRFPFKHN